MKKSLLIAALGLTVPSISSFGAPGTIRFDSYLANNSAGIITTFTGGSHAPVGAGFTADLVYSLTPITDTASSYGSLLPGWSLSGSGAPSAQSVATPFLTEGPEIGYFQSPNAFVLDNYTAGTLVYFEVIAYQTAAGGYADSLWHGHSAPFSETLATGVNLPSDVSFTPFTVFVEPEPTTLALLGVGGLTALVALRRKTV